MTKIHMPAQSNEFIRKIWHPRPMVSAGAYTREKAIKVAEQTGQLIAFGRLYVSNVSLGTTTLHHLRDLMHRTRDFTNSPIFLCG